MKTRRLKKGTKSEPKIKETKRKDRLQLSPEKKTELFRGHVSNDVYSGLTQSVSQSMCPQDRELERGSGEKRERVAYY